MRRMRKEEEEENDRGEQKKKEEKKNLRGSVFFMAASSPLSSFRLALAVHRCSQIDFWGTNPTEESSSKSIFSTLRLSL